MINLGDYDYQNLADNNMDMQFGFFEKETKFETMSPIALPQQYGTFSLLVGGEKQDFVECEAIRHFTKVGDEEKKQNFFPDYRLPCIDTEKIEVGGSGFIKG